MSMLFEKVAPRLPDGWAWSDEWRVDAAGRDEDATDAEGWAYAADFK